MNLLQHWDLIRRHFNQSFRSNFHVAVASLDADGLPTVTPIGSLFLNSDQTGFYFEKYPNRLPQNAENHPYISILAVNSSTWLWLKSLFTGKFLKYPAMRLYGELGSRRKASEIEIMRLRRRMKATKGLKGNDYLWGNMADVREIRFTKVEGIQLGSMTARLP